MTKPAIRVLTIPAEDLARANVQHVVRVFGEISEMPGKAKTLQGLVFLGFPSVDDDPRPNWAIPEVRQFIQRLDEKLPYFAYFLTGDVPFGFLRVYMYCLVALAPNGGLQPQELEALVRRLETDVRAFCDRIADRPDPALERIMINLPAVFVADVPPLRRSALRSLLPVLDAVIGAPDTPEQIKRPVLQEAEVLLGSTVAECGSERALLTRVREHAASDR